MRINADNINEAVRLLTAEHANLKDISDAEDAGELHGSAGLYDDESAAFLALETMLKEAVTITDRL